MEEKIQSSQIKENRQASIQSRLYSFKLPSFADENCLVVAFAGRIVETGSPDSGYAYMHAMIGDGFAASNPASLILDLRKLDYSGGDEMIRIVDQRIVTKVVASPVSFNGLKEIYTSVLFLNPASEIFETVGDALIACDAAYREFLRAGRKRIIAADF
jgi:hypothetical protein